MTSATPDTLQKTSQPKPPDLWLPEGAGGGGDRRKVVRGADFQLRGGCVPRTLRNPAASGAAPGALLRAQSLSSRQKEKLFFSFGPFSLDL